MIFEETESGATIKPAEVLVADALDQIGKALQEKGITLEEIIERGRELRGDLIASEYDLDDEPKK